MENITSGTPYLGYNVTTPTTPIDKETATTPSTERTTQKRPQQNTQHDYWGWNNDECGKTPEEKETGKDDPQPTRHSLGSEEESDNKWYGWPPYKA